MRYLNGTSDHGLLYGKSKQAVSEVMGHVDSNFARDLDAIESITGYLFMLNNCMIGWKASLQLVVALSSASTEAEFVAATKAAKESIWLKGILNELWLNQKTVQIFCDNQSAIQLVKNQMYHEWTKQIDVKLQFIRDEVAKGTVMISEIHTYVNPVTSKCSKYIVFLTKQMTAVNNITTRSNSTPSTLWLQIFSYLTKAPRVPQGTLVLMH